MKIKKLYCLLLVVCLLMTGCTSTPYSDAEVNEIVDDALTRGELANLLYTGEFDTNGLSTARVIIDDQFLYEPVELRWGVPFAVDGDIEPVLQSFSEIEEIEGYIRDTFVPELASQYISAMFPANAPKYLFEDGKLMQNCSTALYPLSLIKWDHKPLDIIENHKNRIVVQLAGTYILTGNKQELPVEIVYQNGKWLLNESFSPEEFSADEYFHTDEELQTILVDVLERAEIASTVYEADFTTISDNDYDYFMLIDKQHQYQEELKIVQRLNTTDDVKAIFFEAFIPEVADDHINALFGDPDHPAYKDFPGGLEQTWAVTYMPLCMKDWHPDDYVVWQDSADEIVLLMKASQGWFPGTGFNDYYVFKMYCVNGSWLTDDSFEASSLKKYGMYYTKVDMVSEQ